MTTIIVNPGQSIQSAINSAQAGDIVQLAAGTHTISSAVSAKTGITLTGATANKADTIITGSGGRVDIFGTSSVFVTDFTLKNLTLNNMSSENLNVRFARNITIDNVWNKGYFYTGQEASSTWVDNLTVTNCEFNRMALIKNIRTGEFAYNIFRNHTEFGFDLQEHNDHVKIHNNLMTNTQQGFRYYSYNDVIEVYDNEMSYNERWGVQWKGNNNSILKNNLIHHNGDGVTEACGILFYAPYDMINDTVTNNLIYNNNGYGITFGTEAGPVVFNGIFTNNVIYGNTKHGIDFNSTASGSTITVKNNIITNNGGYGINHNAGSITLSYNDVWGNTSGSYSGISAGPGSISADPKFINPANGDFHLAVGSPAIGAGEGGIDMGAYTQPAPTNGSISCTTTPAGASVALDGVNQTGAITPVTLTNVSAEAHTVTFTLGGYNSCPVTLTVTAGQTATASCIMTPVTTGSISCTTTPPGASVTLDGVNQGVFTPATLTGVSTGSHNIVYTLSGYNACTVPVTVTSGQTSTANCIMTQIGNIVTVATDGSGDYNTDGTDDQVQINAALNYINSIGGGTVHLKAGTYTIGASVIMPSNTTLEGDGFTSIIKLKASANWATFTPLIGNSGNTGLTIKNLKIDGNKTAQSQPNGYDYYSVFQFDAVSNVIFDNLWYGNNLSDGIYITNSNNITVTNNTSTNIGHSNVRIDKCTNAVIQFNDLAFNTNSSIRLYNSNHIKVVNNKIYAISTGDWGIQLNQESSTYINDVIIENNQIYNVPNSAIIMYAETTQNAAMATGVIIRNNLIYHSGVAHEPYASGGIQIVNFNNTLIESNTIFNNYGNAIYFTDYIYNTTTDRVSWALTATVRNNLIFSNTGYGVTTGNINATISNYYNDIYNNTSGNYNGSITTSHDISVEPMTYLAPIRTSWNPGPTGLIVDLHLKSQYGRWNGTAWVNDTVTSPLIGAGDPASNNSYSPWGGNIEIGAYGNTTEASAPSATTTGSILCTTTPAGAAITIDGVNQSGAVTPILLTNVIAGSHTVMFTLAGYNSCEVTVNVTSGSQATASCTLTPTQMGGITRTLLGQWTSATTGTGSFITSSIVPPSDSLVIIAIGVIEQNGITDPSGSITLSDSGSHIWTPRYNIGAPGGGGLWSSGHRVFTANVSLASMITLTIGCSGRNIAAYTVQAIAYNGYDTVSPIGAIVTNGTAGTTGSLTITLPTAPNITSEVLGFIHGDLFSGSGSSTPGTGWTELYDTSLIDNAWLQSEARTNSTSSAVTWNNINDNTGSAAKTTASAIEIKAAICPQLIATMIMNVGG